ncbi:MAG TPA: hypothetical protein VFT99_21980, partial [Roseiflexaceae bacterium]|nr:hypothetical protein [Roseiflexaceae bacterium]
RSLMKGKSTVIISHDLNLIRHADTILVIQQGELVQKGTHRELLKSDGLYADLYHKQFGAAIDEGNALEAVPVVAQADDDEEVDPQAGAKFHTMIEQIMPQPARPRTFETMMMRVAAPAEPAVPEPANVPAARDQAPASAPATLMLQVGDGAALPADPTAPKANGLVLDPLHSPGLAETLPGLAIALDGDAMRGYIQLALFGKNNATYRVEECKPGKVLVNGTICSLRYELRVANTATGHIITPLVSGRVFADQWSCAVYVRDKLAPLATLMRGRPEIAPFAAPIAMIEPLNMAVHVFPIDGELPTLVGALDVRRMRDVFAEILPVATGGEIAVDHVRAVPVNYARQRRLVLRYEIDARVDGVQERIDVYGKVSNEHSGHELDRNINALRAYILGNASAYQFAIPRSLGFRPDLQLLLIEAIPGQPRINQLLKQRTNGAQLQAGDVTLQGAMDACARIASTLHTSQLLLGQRRTFDHEVAALRRDIAGVQQISPEAGAVFMDWLDQIETYAETSDPLPLRFCHGDYTFSQVIF